MKTALLKHLAFVLLLLLSAACTGREGDGQRLDLKTESRSALYSDSLDLYLYGQTRITRHPLLAGARLKVDYDRDTTDFFLLTDRESGRIILPIIPDSVDVKARVGDKLTITGVQRDFILKEWYALNARDTLSEELGALLRSERDGNLGALLSLASYQRFAGETMLKGILRQSIMRSGELLGALGLDASLFDPQRDYFAYRFGTRKKPLRLPEVMGKDTMMVVSILPADLIADKDTAFLLALDTLSQQRYYILPGTDSLPSAWKKVLEKSEKKNHVTPDSSFTAARLVSDMSLDRLPVYMVVDSLSHVLYKTGDRDSLLTILREADDNGSKSLSIPDKGSDLVLSRRPPLRRPIIRK